MQDTCGKWGKSSFISGSLHGHKHYKWTSRLRYLHYLHCWLSFLFREGQVHIIHTYYVFILGQMHICTWIHASLLHIRCGPTPLHSQSWGISDYTCMCLALVSPWESSSIWTFSVPVFGICILHLFFLTNKVQFFSHSLEVTDTSGRKRVNGMLWEPCEIRPKLYLTQHSVSNSGKLYYSGK